MLSRYRCSLQATLAGFSGFTVIAKLSRMPKLDYPSSVRHPILRCRFIRTQYLRDSEDYYGRNGKAERTVMNGNSAPVNVGSEKPRLEAREMQ
jgi:hypothetical protein